MEACRNVKQFLTAAATFNGSVILVDFDDGEKVHVSQGALQFAALPPPSSGSSALNGAELNGRSQTSSKHFLERLARDARALFRRYPRPMLLAGAALGGLLVLSVFGASPWSLLASALLLAGTGAWAVRRY